MPAWRYNRGDLATESLMMVVTQKIARQRLSTVQRAEKSGNARLAAGQGYRRGIRPIDTVKEYPETVAKAD